MPDDKPCTQCAQSGFHLTGCPFNAQIYLSQDETCRLITETGPRRTAVHLPWGSTDPRGLRLLPVDANLWAFALVGEWRKEAARAEAAKQP